MNRARFVLSIAGIAAATTFAGCECSMNSNMGSQTPAAAAATTAPVTAAPTPARDPHIPAPMPRTVHAPTTVAPAAAAPKMPVAVVAEHGRSSATPAATPTAVPSAIPTTLPTAIPTALPANLQGVVNQYIDAGH
jgi:hypothetical protein